MTKKIMWGLLLVSYFAVCVAAMFYPVFYGIMGLINGPIAGWTIGTFISKKVNQQ